MEVEIKKDRKKIKFLTPCLFKNNHYATALQVNVSNDTIGFMQEVCILVVFFLQSGFQN